MLASVDATMRGRLFIQAYALVPRLIRILPSPLSHLLLLLLCNFFLIYFHVDKRMRILSTKIFPQSSPSFWFHIATRRCSLQIFSL